MLIEAFVPQPAIEAFDKAILHRLSGSNVVPLDVAILLPFEDRIGSELSPIVALFYVVGWSMLEMMGPEFGEAWLMLMILTLGCWFHETFQLIEILLTFIRPRANVVGASIAIFIYLIVVGATQSQFGLNGQVIGIQPMPNLEEKRQ